MWGAWDRLMRQLSEEDIIKRDCNIYKTKHFLVMKKKNTYAQVHFQFTFIILRPDGLYSFLQIPYKKRLFHLNAFGSWFTSFSRVLPTSQVGYHAGKPIESVVYYFYKITFIRTEPFTKKMWFWYRDQAMYSL